MGSQKAIPCIYFGGTDNGCQQNSLKLIVTIMMKGIIVLGMSFSQNLSFSANISINLHPVEDLEAVVNVYMYHFTTHIYRYQK